MSVPPLRSVPPAEPAEVVNVDDTSSDHSQRATSQAAAVAPSQTRAAAAPQKRAAPPAGRSSPPAKRAAVPAGGDLPSGQESEALTRKRKGKAIAPPPPPKQKGFVAVPSVGGVVIGREPGTGAPARPARSATVEQADSGPPPDAVKEMEFFNSFVELVPEVMGKRSPQLQKKELSGRTLATYIARQVALVRFISCHTLILIFPFLFKRILCHFFCCFSSVWRLQS